MRRVREHQSRAYTAGALPGITDEGLIEVYVAVDQARHEKKVLVNACAEPVRGALTEIAATQRD
jgi:hypothetical protein